MNTNTCIRCTLSSSNPISLDELSSNSSSKPLTCISIDKSTVFICFSSATEAVLHAESLILTGSQGIQRLIIHTLECELNAKSLEQGFSHLLNQTMEQSSLSISKSTFLLVDKTEILGALIPLRRAPFLYNWRAIQPEVAPQDESLSLQQLRFYSVAIDYLLLLLLYISFHIVWLGPKTLLTIWHRNRIEAESMHIENGHKDFFWRASSGQAVNLSKAGYISHNFPFPTGTYAAQFAYRTKSASTQVTLYKNNSSFHISLPERRQFSVINIGKFDFHQGDILQFHSSDAIDYIEYSRPDATLAAPGVVQNVDRFSDVLHLMGLWGQDSYLQAASTLFLMIPATQCILGFVLLTFFRFTPGAWLLGLEITTPEGTVPGLRRALLRYIGLLASVPALGLGWFWSVLTGEDKTWSDLLSRTQVYRRGCDET